MAHDSGPMRKMPIPKNADSYKSGSASGVRPLGPAKQTRPGVMQQQNAWNRPSGPPRPASRA